MGKMSDNWANAYRNWRAWFMAFLMCLLIAWIFVNDAFGPSLIDRSRVNMIVVGVGIKSPTNEEVKEPIIYTIELESLDKKIIKTTTGLKPVPRIGDKLPVIVEHYDDEKKLYFIDHAGVTEQRLGM